MENNTAEIIFDRDHGAENEGWYARVRDNGGMEEDVPFDAPSDATDAQLIAAAGLQGCAVAVKR